MEVKAANRHIQADWTSLGIYYDDPKALKDEK
jgi:hypothetical protein